MLGITLIAELTEFFDDHFKELQVYWLLLIFRLILYKTHYLQEDLGDLSTVSYIRHIVYERI